MNASDAIEPVPLPFLVAMERDASGAVSRILVTRGDAVWADLTGELIDGVLRLARERANADPYADHLPPDWAIIDVVVG